MSTMAKNEPIPVDDQSLSFRQIVDSSPALLHTARPDGYLDFFNQTWLDFAGVPLERLLGWGWTSCIHPEDVEALVQKMRESFAKGKPFQETSRVRRADGVYRWMLHQKVPIFDGGGSIIKWYGSSIDIDDRKRAEEQLLKSAQESQRGEFYLAEAQRLGHIGSWIFDPAIGFEHWSRELFQIHGLDPAEAPPSSEQYLALVHPEDREFMASVMKRMLLDDSGFDVTKRIVRAGGEVRYVRCVGTAVSDNVPSKRMGVGIDVTDHEVLTQELRRRESALQKREHELLGIIETIPSMLWSTSPTGETTHLSQRVLKYCGAPLEELVNRGWENFIHPDDLEETVKAQARALSSGESYSAIHRIRRADGEHRWHNSMAEPLRDPHGKIIQWYGLAIDIDERKRTEDHLRETRMKLSRAARIATVAELSASIAHELNQPLMSVLANAQAGKRWLACNPPNLVETNASIDRILKDARGADETMQHIRALFKRESFSKREASIPEIMGEAVRLVQEDPNKLKVYIDWSVDGALPEVHVDPILIQEVFINLISNAIEAMEGNRIPPLLKVRVAVTDQNEMLIQVIDNGPGVNDTEKIFEAFVTTKESGMGIGLAVSRSIVETHGGRLWAENNPSGGATFSVALPLASMSRSQLEVSESRQW